MGAIRVTGMDHIVLSVSDVERALKFYMDTLGLKGERVEEYRRGENRFPSVRISEETIIDLFGTDGALLAEGPRNLNHYCLVLSPDTDFNAVMRELKSQGVPIRGEPASRWGAKGRGTSIYVMDPDGNEIELRAYQ